MRCTQRMGQRVSMNARQLLTQRCAVDGREINPPNLQHRLLCLLLGADPAHFVSVLDLIEGVYPNPDLEPEGAWQVIVVCVHRLRKRGVPIESHRSSSSLIYGRYRIPECARSELRGRSTGRFAMAA